MVLSGEGTGVREHGDRDAELRDGEVRGSDTDLGCSSEGGLCNKKILEIIKDKKETKDMN